jgi:hypothetical protein
MAQTTTPTPCGLSRSWTTAERGIESGDARGDGPFPRLADIQVVVGHMAYGDDRLQGVPSSGMTADEARRIAVNIARPFRLGHVSARAILRA